MIDSLEVLKNIDHPHIARVIELMETEKFYYIITEQA